MDTSYCRNCKQKRSGDAALKRLKALLAHLKRTVKPTKGGRLGIIWEFRTKCSRGLYCNELEQMKYQINKTGEELEPYLCTLTYTVSLEDELRKTMEQLRDYFPIAYDTLESAQLKQKRR